MIDQIRTEHKKLTNTSVSQDVDIETMPLVLYQGCSIHGNEPSGANGALAMVYYLAAAEGERIERLLPIHSPVGSAPQLRFKVVI